MTATVEHEWEKGNAVLLTLSLLEDQPRHGYEIGRLIDMAPQAHFISTPPPDIPCCIGSKNAAGSKDVGPRKPASAGGGFTG